jgi:ADP-ribose pyrophosphatase YjhB (NUDIX family)
LVFSGNLKNWKKMKFLFGLRHDGYNEPLGGGYDLRDSTPVCAASREIEEESGLKVGIEDLTLFAAMVQKLPSLGENEKGYAFYFFRKINCKDAKRLTLVNSHEHKSVGWHTVEDIFKQGDTLYKTAALRAVVHLLHYLGDKRKKIRFGVLGDEVSFKGRRF